ncbi:MAG TPA: tetratricopeptide repeat protein [Vicinamibacterales bacterium]|nr:tetratricopeptide repeat protein [Vicinamibacterales bacterium]
MHTRWLTRQLMVPALILGGVTGLIAWTNLREGRPEGRSSRAVPARRAAAGTSSQELDRVVAGMNRRLEMNPGDVRAAVDLADALLRLARVRSDGGLVARGEQALRAALDRNPADYQAQQMLGSIYLSQHKFRQAADVARRATVLRPHDAINFGMLGDALLELGEYEPAFDAFDSMMQLRPNAAAYARVAYARELQGDLAGSLESMRLALDAVPPGDSESLAWHHAQVGDLHLKLGNTAAAVQDFIAASHAFPGHPFAVLGYARALAARGDRDGAIAVLGRQADHTTNPDLHLLFGDLLAASGRQTEATRHYAVVEAAWRGDTPEPRSLSKFLAARGRVDEAVAFAELAARARDDIFTDDALAWAYHNAGRTSEAARAADRALRTGTRDRDILEHAAAIRAAVRARQ